MFFKQRFHKSVLEGRSLEGKDPSDNDMLTVMVMVMMTSTFRLCDGASAYASN